jgi:hypothetical protein
MPAHDEICTLANCGNLKDCRHMCAPILWIGRDKKPKEIFARDINAVAETRNYNDVLHTLMRRGDRRGARINDIAEIDDMRLRAVAAMLHANMTVSDIARVMRVSNRWVELILQEGRNRSKLAPKAFSLPGTMYVPCIYTKTKRGAIMGAKAGIPVCGRTPAYRLSS